MELRIIESGDQGVALRFRRLEGVAKDFRAVWPEVRAYFHGIEGMQFTSEGGAGRSGRWAPLSAKYAKWKARHHPGRGILERTGALWKSLTGGPGGRAILERMRFTEESMVPYAKHHLSKPAGKPRLPVSLTERQQREIGAIIGRFVQRDIRKTFAGSV